MELNKLYKKADNYLTNLSIGLGRGVTNQLEGLSGMIEHPINTLQGLYGIASQPGQIPGMVKNALVDTARRGSSGPMGLGEVIGENVGFGRRAPSKLDMTVYHGSPHDFDKFDMSKIGTGEGAQAYGHGLYVAEAPAVARQYAGDLSAAKATQPVGNVDLQQAYQNLPNDVPDTLLAARRDFRALKDAGELSQADRRDFLTAVKNNLVASKGGKLYSVDLPDEHIANMLDWDAPLSQQPESVRKALESAKAFAFRGMPVAGKMEIDGNRLYNALTEKLGGKQQATEYLHGLGITGIKYLDGGSRAAGDGTRNYVVFDDKLLKILKKE